VRVARSALGVVATGVCLLALNVTPVAAAGTVTIVDEPNPVNHTLQFTAGAGDVNNVTVTQAGSQFTISDAGAVMTTAQAGCTGSGTNTVSCTDAAITQIGASLGDGSDRIANDTAVGSDFAGGDGGDTLIGSSAADFTIDGGPGNDTVDGRDGNDGRIFGLLGGLGTDRVVGGSGNDALRGGDLIDTPGDGGDELDAGDGTDSLMGGEGADTLLGGAGVDTLDGGADPDDVFGGPGDDRLQELADGAADHLDGGSGDDRFGIVRFPFPPDQGDDVMNGAAGFDFVDVQDFTFLFSGGFDPNSPLRLTLADGLANDGLSGQALNLLSIEDVDAGSPGGSDDFIRGTSDANALRTFDGDDDVDGGAGPDVIALGSGEDVVDARDGSQDRIDCGPDDDSATVDQIDVLSECEDVTVVFVQPAGTSPLPPAGPPPIAPPPPPPPPAPAYATPPRCTISAPRRVRSLQRTIRVVSRCNPPSALRVVLTAAVRSRGARAAAAGDMVLVERSLGRGAAARTLRLRIPARLRRSLGGRARLRLRVEATDAAGGRSVVTKSISYRRRG
jgi:hypothetical protein